MAGSILIMHTVSLIILILGVVNQTSGQSQGVCKNNNQYCPGWAKAGYCSTNVYVQKNCEKSCGTCQGSVCVDLSSSCSGWLQYCRSSDHVKYNCKMTCGLCSIKPVTTAPTRPPVTKVVPGGSCGRPSYIGSRVIAGETAKPGAWPWQMLMLYNGRGMCGGTLIAPNWVLTAAHCVSGKNARSFSLRAGEHYTGRKDGNEQDIRVVKVVTNRRYSSRTFDSDIALMKVERPFKLNSRVGLACLPDKQRPVPVGTDCYITGWGKIRHPGNMHHTLQQGKIPVVSQSTCKNLNTRTVGIQITDNMVCAGHGGRTHLSGCHGDSGGPFVCKTGSQGAWEVHGAVSWGSGSCSSRLSYTVFARVTALRDWIDYTMKNN